jgi:hypothetical protein
MGGDGEPKNTGDQELRDNEQEARQKTFHLSSKVEVILHGNPSTPAERYTGKGKITALLL